MDIKTKVKISNQLPLFHFKEIKECTTCCSVIEDDQDCKCEPEKASSFIYKISYNNKEQTERF